MLELPAFAKSLADLAAEVSPPPELLALGAIAPAAEALALERGQVMPLAEAAMEAEAAGAVLGIVAAMGERAGVPDLFKALPGDVLGRFRRVPQPLRLRGKAINEPKSLTPAEAMERIMASKNHQHQLNVRSPEERAAFRSEFQRTWVGDRPYLRTEIDMQRLNRRPFVLDEAKVAELVKHPPKPDGNHPIIAPNESASDHPHLILDGNHRIEAALRRGDATMTAYVHEALVPELVTGTIAKGWNDLPPELLASVGRAFGVSITQGAGGKIVVTPTEGVVPADGLTQLARKRLRLLEGTKGGCYADGVLEVAKRKAKAAGRDMATIEDVTAAEAEQPIAKSLGATAAIASDLRARADAMPGLLGVIAGVGADAFANVMGGAFERTAVGDRAMLVPALPGERTSDTFRRRLRIGLGQWTTDNELGARMLAAIACCVDPATMAACREQALDGQPLADDPGIAACQLITRLCGEIYAGAIWQRALAFPGVDPDAIPTPEQLAEAMRQVGPPLSPNCPGLDGLFQFAKSDPMKQGAGGPAGDGLGPVMTPQEFDAYWGHPPSIARATILAQYGMRKPAEHPGKTLARAGYRNYLAFMGQGKPWLVEEPNKENPAIARFQELAADRGAAYRDRVGEAACQLAGGDPAEITIEHVRAAEQAIDGATAGIAKAIVNVKQHQRHTKSGAVAQVRAHTMTVDKHALVAALAQHVGGHDQLPDHEGLHAAVDRALDQHHETGGRVKHVRYENGAWRTSNTKPQAAAGQPLLHVGGGKVKLSVGGEHKGEVAITSGSGPSEDAPAEKPAIAPVPKRSRQAKAKPSPTGDADAYRAAHAAVAAAQDDMEHAEANDDDAAYNAARDRHRAAKAALEAATPKVDKQHVEAVKAAHPQASADDHSDVMGKPHHVILEDGEEHDGILGVGPTAAHAWADAHAKLSAGGEAEPVSFYNPDAKTVGAAVDKLAAEYAEFRDPDVAYSMCEPVAKEVAAKLRAMGFPQATILFAEGYKDSLKAGAAAQYWSQQRQDPDVKSEWGHFAVKVGDYVVDFTRAQFGKHYGSKPLLTMAEMRAKFHQLDWHEQKPGGHVPETPTHPAPAPSTSSPKKLDSQSPSAMRKGMTPAELAAGTRGILERVGRT